MKSVQLLYVVYDTAADDYSPVYQAPNDKVARRQFVDLISKTPYPDEYQLMCIGSVNFDEHCELSPGYRVVDINMSELPNGRRLSIAGGEIS